MPTDEYRPPSGTYERRHQFRKSHVPLNNRDGVQFVVVEAMMGGHDVLEHGTHAFPSAIG
jgi:hypothetical protein